MKTIQRTLQKLIAQLIPLPAEMTSISQSLGRVLAEDISAPNNHPQHDTAYIDGYAVLMEDITQMPVTLNKIANSTITSPYTTPLNHGETVLVYNGAQIPPNCQTIIPYNHADHDGDEVTLNDTAAEGQNIALQGLDIGKGDILLQKGEVITASAINLASMMHLSWLPVTRKPRIGILSTGSELSMIGEKHHGHEAKNVASSFHALEALLTSYGAAPTNLGIFPDDIDAITGSLINHPNLELIITTGGLSLSANKLMVNCLQKVGKDIEEITLSIGRGETILISRVNNTTIVSLPGNPASTLICAALLIRPLIEYMLGIPRYHLKVHNAILGRNLDRYDTKANFLHATIEYSDNGTIVVDPVSGQDTLLSSSLHEADCLILLEPDMQTKAGSIVEIIPLNNTLF